MYSALDKLRAGDPLTPKEREVYDLGLVGVLRTLHDELDAAVLGAYGWSDLAHALADCTPPGAAGREAAVGQLPQRLVDLNARRAAEEAAGTIRWLRPEFQNPTAGATAAQTSMEAEEEPAEAAQPVTPTLAASIIRRPWPAGLPEQIKAVAEVLATRTRALSLADLEARFTARGRWRERLPTILETLEAVGRARKQADQRWQGM